MNSTPSPQCNLIGYKSPPPLAARPAHFHSATTPAVSGKCNLIGYTFRRAPTGAAALVAVLLAAFALPLPSAHASSCCQKPAAKPAAAACCSPAQPAAASCCSPEKPAAKSAASCCGTCQPNADPASCCKPEAATQAASCCAPAQAATPTPASCCSATAPDSAAATNAATDPNASRELPPTDVTRDSLYQLDATYTTDSGQPFQLAQLRGRPVLLAMFFASCNYACPLIVADLTRLRDALPPALRAETAIVLVSFDVARDTPAALKKYRDDRLLDASWTLLHGDDDAVAELAALLGVKYKQEADGQFAHSNLISLLNREGEVVHQRAGLSGGLAEAAAALAAKVP